MPGFKDQPSGKWCRLSVALLTTVVVHGIFIFALDRITVNSVAGLAGVRKSFDVTLAGATPSTDTRKILTTFKQEQVNPSLLPDSISSVQTQPTHLANKSADEIRRAQYFAKNILQNGPVPLSDIQPVYPEKAGSIQGVVVLTIYVNERGGVDEIVVVRTFPEGLFEQSAVEAFSKALFSPGTKLGVPVKSQMTIEVSFSAFTKM